MPALDLDNPSGFFDGAIRGHPPSCGVEVVLFINQRHYMHIKYALSSGSNNRAEFIALRTLLAIAQEKGSKKLQVMGDSKLIID
jgi:ribonuclease HI